MADATEILRQRIRQRLDETGKSAHAVSLQIGANPGYVRDLLDPEKTGMPSAARLLKLAAALETTSDWLLGRLDDAGQVVSEVSFREAPQPWRGPAESGIRVLGTGYCADLSVESDGGQARIEQLELDMDHTVRLIERPPALWNAPDAYAIYFHGSSMEPRFFQGEIGVVDTRRHPGPGDFVVVQLNDGSSDHVVCVLVKQLVRSTSAAVELEQFNPPLRFRIPRAQIARLHRIVSLGELLGG